MRKFKRRVVRFAEFQVVCYVATFFYFAGLTALIPLVPLFFSPDWVHIKVALAVSVGLILFGFSMVYLFSRKSIAFRVLGLSTLIPGLIAIGFLFNQGRMARLMSFVSGVPLVEGYIELYVPNAWLLAGIYIILGCLLVWLSYQVRD